MKRMMPECRSQMPPEGEKEKSGLHTPLPGCVFSLHVLRNSEVKWMSTSQKKRRTLLPFQKRAPTSSPFPRENSPFSWMKVKFLKLAALKGEERHSPSGFPGQQSPLENTRPRAIHIQTCFFCNPEGNETTKQLQDDPDSSEIHWD